MSGTGCKRIYPLRRIAAWIVNLNSSFRSSETAQLRYRFRLLSISFVVAIVLLAGISLMAIELLSGATAYVRGESLYSKAQKQAVISLLEYASTGREFARPEYAASMQVLAGDRQARIALDRDDPELEAARDGFLDGGNHPQDISEMVRLFRIGRHWPLFREAIGIWEQADGLVRELENQAEVLIEQVASFGPGNSRVKDQIRLVAQLDRELTRLEDRFTSAISRISRYVVSVSFLAVVVAGSLLILIVVAFGRRQREFAESAELTLRESEQRYRALVDQPEVGMWQIDPDGRVVYFNPGMRSLLSIDDDESIEGIPIVDFVVAADRDKIFESRRQRESGEQTTVEVDIQSRLGEVRRVLVHGAPIMPRPGQVIGHVGTCVDVTQRQRVEAKLHQLAFYDPLTHLCNRRMFTDQLRKALERARRRRWELAVLYIDLDRFKVVNDAMGHAIGDRILREAARRLKSVVRDEDTVARLGGDEFGMILEDVDSRAGAGIPAQRIIDAFGKEFRIDDLRARIGVSVGIAIWDGQGAADLMRHADIAMYSAKRGGGRQWQYYDPAVHAFQEKRLSLESDLWHAASRNELVVHYQPIVELESGKLHALEALVRWQHPGQGLLDPGHFIGLAEETGAIAMIGDWVTRRVCLDLSDFRQLDYWPRTACMSINVSDAEFNHCDPVARVRDICTETGIEPNALQMEVTESLMSLHPQGLRGFAELGCSVSIDDFGTGYASLDRLREVDFAAIKIDKSFVQHLPGGRVDRAIVDSLIQLASRLDRKVIAEGVETPDQREMLLEMGCHLAQGYLFARPMPKDELEKFILGVIRGRP